MAEELMVFGVFDGGEPFGQPALVEQELPVDPREDTAVHQQVKQMRDGSPGGFLVQPVMGERDFARGQALEKLNDVGVAQPDESALGPVHLQQDLDQRQQLRGDTANAVVEEVGERVGEGAVFAEAPAKQ
ncbi:hypothetical protein ACFWAR_00610 [Streptomyces sp. NPDC059917]|uniref:hypothetical protein n=1 Tax=Streptomyces sp. NPDC059917 TaxID=3347002 RepID=UPI00365CE75D